VADGSTQLLASPAPEDRLRQGRPRRPSPGSGRLLRSRSPWIQAPVLLLSFPGILVAMVASVFVLTLAAASGPMFLSSAGNGAVREQLALVSPWNAGLTVITTGPVAGPIRSESPLAAVTAEGLFNGRDTVLRSLAKEIPALSSPVVTVAATSGTLATLGERPKLVDVRPMTRTGALDHVRKLQRAGGRGLWLSQTTARQLGTRAGATVRFSRAGTKGYRTRVAGIYQDFAPGPLPVFWQSLSTYIHSIDLDHPPPYLAFADDATFRELERRTDDVATFQWEFPLARQRLTLEEGQATSAGIQRAEILLRGLAPPYRGFFFAPTVRSLFPDLLIEADRAAVAAKTPVETLSLAGRLGALAVAGAAGIYWTHRRRSEFRLLSARGVRAVTIGARTLIEAAIPAVVAATAGWMVVAPIIRRLGPSDLISPAATDHAFRDVERTVLLAILLTGIVVAVGASQTVREAGTRTRDRLARLPWEIILLALAGASYYEIVTRGGGVVEGPAGPKVDRLLLLFPLLFIAGASGLVVRALRFGLARLRGAGRRRAPWAFLAFRRLAGAPGIALLLVAASALSIGVLAYAGALASSLGPSMDAKARTFIGSDVSVVLGGDHPAVPAGFPFPATVITRIAPTASLFPSNEDVEIIGVDPATFARAAYWQEGFASEPLPPLLRGIVPRIEPTATLRALVLPRTSVPSPPMLQVGTHLIRLRLAGTIRNFPGASTTGSVLVLDRGALEVALLRVGIKPGLLPSRVELWARGEPAKVRGALSREHVPYTLPTSAPAVRESPGFLALTWTFGFMQMIGVVAGIVALVGVVLYLQARQRNREVSYALATRMGLSGPAHWLSLVLELAGLLGTAFVVGTALAVAAARLTFTRLDPIPKLPPTMLFRPPGPVLGMAAAALLVATAIGAAEAQWRAQRARAAEVMRLAG
jgi:putative ABC transport system permease protein